MSFPQLGKTIPDALRVISSASFAFAGSDKMAKDLEGKGPSDQVDVIVQFKQAPTARHHQKVLSKGGTLKGVLSVLKGALIPCLPPP